MVQIIETETEQPICPHCGTKQERIFARKLTSTFGVRFIYFCAKCKKTLGLSHRKGFWMG